MPSAGPPTPSSQVDRLLVTKNPRDPVLKLYPLLYRRGGTEAMGLVGPVCRGRTGPDGRKIELLDMSSSVGHAHAWTKHLKSGGLRRQLARYTFAEPPAAPQP